MPSIVLDLVVLCIFIGCAIYYGTRGFVSSLIDLLGNIASIGLAYLAGNHFSAVIFNTWFRTPLLDNTLTMLRDAGVSTLEELLPQMVGFLPHSVIENMVAEHSDIVVEATPAVANLIVNEVIAPIIIPMLAIIVFMVVFLLLRLLLGFIASLLKGLNKTPLLGGVNRLLGVVVGVLVAFLYTLVLISVLWLIDVAYGGFDIMAGYFGNSIVYRFFSTFSLFRNAPFL